MRDKEAFKKKKNLHHYCMCEMALCILGHHYPCRISGPDSKSTALKYTNASIQLGPS